MSILICTNCGNKDITRSAEVSWNGSAWEVKTFYHSAASWADFTCNECLDGTKVEFMHPRRCDVTGKGMSSGWCVMDGEFYVSDEVSDEDAAKWISKNVLDYDPAKHSYTMEELYEYGIAYWTEWEDLEDTGFDADGTEWVASEYAGWIPLT